jgi:hypothetical protein
MTIPISTPVRAADALPLRRPVSRLPMPEKRSRETSTTANEYTG